MRAHTGKHAMVAALGACVSVLVVIKDLLSILEYIGYYRPYIRV